MIYDFFWSVCCKLNMGIYGPKAIVFLYFCSVAWEFIVTIFSRSHIFCALHVRLYQHKSGRPKMFSKKGVLRNFAKFTGKHLCQVHLRTPFLTEHLWWLCLSTRRKTASGVNDTFQFRKVKDFNNISQFYENWA